MAEWRSRAFGLEIEGDFDAPGLPPVTDAAAGPLTRVGVVDGLGTWDGGTRLLSELEGTRTIDHVPGRGYRLYARGFGEATVSEDGALVRCSPPDGLEPWSWQRFLVGRVLPWAAVLRGRELFHASAVVTDGGAVAFVGATGTGKTSLAARLVLAGGRFLTDDVLALERTGEAIVGHPGTGLLCVRPSEAAVIAAGRVLGESGKTYVEVDRVTRPVRLRALVYLAPGTEAGVEPIAPDPRRLLGATFNQSLRSPERLRRQFELCADLAERVPLLRLTLGPDSAGAARAMLEWL